MSLPEHYRSFRTTHEGTDDDRLMPESPHGKTLPHVAEEEHQAVLSVTAEGRIRFSTPQVQRLLAEYGLLTRRGSDRLPARLQAWLREHIEPLASTDGGAPPGALLTITGTTGTLQIRVIPNGGQYCLLLQESRPPAATNLSLLGLTKQQTAIVGWVAQGKTNTEIGQILGISLRTVQKHLEHIYDRLGVDNRHAASALVLSNHRTLGYDHPRRLSWNI